MMYDVLASYYDALVEDAQARDAWIELIEANIRGRSILDAACGSGDIAIELASRRSAQLCERFVEAMAEAHTSE